MQSFVTLAALLSVVTAAPFKLVSRRTLPERSVTDNTSCPGILTAGQFEFPHYITQISKSNPDKTYGQQYNGVFSPNDMATVFMFDIPASRADANCTLEFLFPTQSQLRTSSYSFSGNGSFLFTAYSPGSCPGPQTTYNNQPKAASIQSFTSMHVAPGNAYTIDVGPCSTAAGTCIAGMLSTNDTTFTYFQDQDNCPIGLYTTYSYGMPPSNKTKTPEGCKS